MLWIAMHSILKPPAQPVVDKGSGLGMVQINMLNFHFENFTSIIFLNSFAPKKVKFSLHFYSL